MLSLVNFRIFVICIMYELVIHSQTFSQLSLSSCKLFLNFRYLLSKLYRSLLTTLAFSLQLLVLKLLQA